MVLVDSWNFDGKNKELAKVLEKFLNASNASDALQILGQHPELLSEDVDSVLNALLGCT